MLNEKNHQIKTNETVVTGNESNFMTLLNTIPDAVLIRNMDGLYIEANHAACIRLGYKKEELIGKSFKEINPKEYVDKINIIEPTLHEKKNLVFISKYKTKSGKEIPVELNTSLISFNDTDAILVIAKDINERSRAENALRESQEKLQLLNDELQERVKEEVEKNRKMDEMLNLQGRQAAMGEMIGIIAHQWRQPLNTIGLILQLFEEYFKMGKLSKEFFRTHVSKAFETLKYMSSTIDDFRDFFKTNKLELDFNVVEIINQLVNMVRESYRYNDITIENNCSLELFTKGHPNELAQVVLNIMNNARDALIQHNNQNRQIAISIKTQNNTIILEINNNGGQIPEDIIKKIFDPYFSTKAEKQGTGLGLYLSKTIIEKNFKGSIDVENIQEGVKFTLRLPEIFPSTKKS